MTCVRGRLDAFSGADHDEAAEIAPNSTALSHRGASAGGHFIEPLPGGPSQACPPSTDPRRTANECRGAAPNAGEDPFRHASPPHPTTSKSSRRKIPQRHGLRKSRRLAKTSSGLLAPQPPRATENLGASNETLLELTICRSHPDVARCPQIQVGRPNVESVQLRGRLSYLRITKAGAGPVRCNGSLGRARISHEGPGV